MVAEERKKLIEEVRAGMDPLKLVQAKERVIKSGRGEVEKSLGLLREGNVFQRWILAQAAGDTGIQDAVPDLVILLEDESPSVRVVAAQSLLKLGSPQGIPTLLKSLNDTSVFIGEPPVLVSYYAQKVLVGSTGQRIRFDPTDEKARREGVDRWQDWWEKNQGTFKPVI